ncbi:lytic transglycosylase domain-containing protein [Chitinasiproducens palmae]|uniref:Soluble lytic murein transglycosylase n=1 Tax=Chitinasiproducens palmae TaxID=1770053 RepID=A0A1H2PT96_9BURK|nr:lytic transglycosylase domain-containing protein [Chitinasiproducens palmae]SDV50327.1 soluble lytic murein transglycosylase [Chitinasiproducens palmae]
MGQNSRAGGRVYRACLLAGALLASVAGLGGSAFAQGVGASDDQTFVSLREAARRNDAPLAQTLAARLVDYPAPSYVEYFTIKPQMFDASGRARVDVPDEQIRSFLSRYDGTAIADRLRNDYLVVLGARRDWRTFQQEYPRFALDDDTQVKCYALEARAASGQQVADDARRLLVDPRWYGDGCVDLIAALADYRQFGPADVWDQVRLAYEGNYTSLGSRIADALGPARPDNALLSMASSRPPLLLARQIVSDTMRQVALLAVTRMAANDPDQAAQQFASIQMNFSPEDRATAWGTIGYRAALKRSPQALDYYRLSVNGRLSQPAQEWRVRSALLAQDWPTVRWAIESMSPELREQPAWLYWHGRALAKTGNVAAANQDFARVADRFDFYGQLATEALGRPVTVPPRTTVSDADVQRMAGNPGFQLAQRFYTLNLRLEGNREWNWQLRGMNDRQLIAAARYAERIQLLDRTVNTADRTKGEHDFTLRYLAPFRDTVARYSRQTDLDDEWAYGLIRQESRFILSARSGVGASGLMQLMPGTADLVARKLGLGKLSRAQVNELDTNIQLGTAYLAMIYDQFDRSPVLATAGYNAGPGRSRQWRSTLTQPVEGAIFAESIPFTETRDYVKNVLSNTVYYGVLFEGRPQSLTSRLGVISP